MRAAGPEDDSKDDHYRGDREYSPGNSRGGVLRKIYSSRAHVFGARKLQVGEFLDRWRGLRFHRRGSGFDRTTFFLYCRGSGPRAIARAFRLPDLIGVDLSLSQTCKVVSDRLLVVESEMLGIGADKSFVEDAAG